MRFFKIVFVFLILSGYSFADNGNSYLFMGFCRDFSGINNVNVSLTYQVYSLNYSEYDISELNIYGGIDYRFSDDATQQDLGYMVGLRWTFLFVNVSPTYNRGYVRSYIDYQLTCQVFFGANLPVNDGR